MRLAITGELNSSAWEGLLKLCSPCLTGTDNLLEIDFANADWSPPSGLVPLAALIKLIRSSGVEIRIVEYPSRDVCSYYCRMNFFATIGVHSPCEHNRNNGAGRFIEITELHAPQITQDIAGQLAQILEAAPEANESSKASFIDACGELVSNTRHAYDSNVDPNITGNPPALIQAQYYPKLSQIEFCIADLGVGIKASIESTTEAGTSASDSDAIVAALALGNKNEQGGGAGLGLAALETYIKKNSGSFAIRSGDALRTLKRKSIRVTEKLAIWRGTIVTLQLEVESDADLSKVWERMA